MSPTTEILLLPDGTLYVHNLTPEIAQLLSELDPSDAQMCKRASAAETAPSSQQNVKT